MASFFKRALGVFVEFDDDQNSELVNTPNSVPNLAQQKVSNIPNNQIEAEKFEKYFDKLFEQSNFPGPDYYEYFKMMETLEAHITDESARFLATFASLSIQGLTKQTLIETAGKYKTIIEKDRADFDRALIDKLKLEVGQRKTNLDELEKKIISNSELIQKLTKEITESQVLMSKIKAEVLEEENKITKNSNGYQFASQAVLNKITTDIQKIQNLL